jgi:hypothetical protein
MTPLTVFSIAMLAAMVVGTLRSAWHAAPHFGAAVQAH